MVPKKPLARIVYSTQGIRYVGLEKNQHCHDTQLEMHH